MKDWISNWWHGEIDQEAVDRRESGPGFTVIGPAPIKRHWTAEWARAVLGFLRAYWQFLIMAAIMAAGVIVAML